MINLEKISLIQLQKKLNNEMRCPAGQNQVYILSQISTNGRIKKQSPRICLDCRVRDYLGWRKTISLDYIQKTCSGTDSLGNPNYKIKCEAYQKFMARQRNHFGR